MNGKRIGVLFVTLALAFDPRSARASSHEVVPPRRLDSQPVPYPKGGEGDASVSLVLVLDASGAVIGATVREGASPFAEAAVEAVRGWQFAPATRDELPIPSKIVANVAFHTPAPLGSPAAAPVSSAASAHAESPAPPARSEADAEVFVKGEREEPSTNHVSRTETRLVPGAFGDPFRIVEALPGMAPWLSGLPYYYVRGVPPESVGYYVDGVPVPLLFHVGAGPSTIAPALVDSVDLFPGAYPARYGRYAGAIIAGESTAPAPRARGELAARVFDASAFVEAPLDDSGRTTVLAAGRYAYTGALTSIIVPNYGVDYWDYQLRAAHRFGGGDMVSLFAFGSYDQLTYKHDPTFHIEYHRVDLRYDHALSGGSDRRDGNLRVAGTLGYDDTMTALQTTSGAGANAALQGPSGRLRAELDQRVSRVARVRAGADLALKRFTVDNFDAIHRPPHTDGEAGIYADVVWRPTRAIEVVPGIRLDGYQARDGTTVAPQPRLANRIRVSPRVSWISALGTAHQEATEQVFVPAKLPNPIDESSREDYQFSEAVEVTLPSSVRLRVTAFSSRLVANQVGEDHGEGLELFVRRDFTQRLGGFVSYTLSRTDTTLGRKTIRSLWDRTHLLSIVLGYDLGSNWRVGGRFFLESGRPYTCQVPDCSAAPTANAVTLRGDLPAFYRLDVRLEKKWLFAAGRWLAATLECFNAFDKAEPINVDYSPAFGLTVRKQSPIILPSVGIEAGF